ncbi:hypothetical protein CEXT_73981 [Caerostris extrusa]|uniref:Uncharacterized protein n=1 Tax=Caerostris extrusa TaxID=172846 RepID=A0AAV4N5R3_CAEEX|nr:hypothetical protein CEXT_73981 [Caerostris extrusa]
MSSPCVIHQASYHPPFNMLKHRKGFKMHSSNNMITATTAATSFYEDFLKDTLFPAKPLSKATSRIQSVIVKLPSKPVKKLGKGPQLVCSVHPFPTLTSCAQKLPHSARLLKNMQRCAPVQIETRPQLVPNPGSPLSLEAWSMADFESWLCDNTTLLRNTNNAYNHLSIDSTQKLTTAYHNSVHVNIPSPSSGMCTAAESPTLYDSPPGKSYNSGPPPYVQVKQEIEEDYQCSGMRMAPANGMNSALNVKREEEEGLSDQMEQLRNLAVEQAAKEIHVACEILNISHGEGMFFLSTSNEAIQCIPIATRNIKFKVFRLQEEIEMTQLWDDLNSPTQSKNLLFFKVHFLCQTRIWEVSPIGDYL